MTHAAQFRMARAGLGLTVRDVATATAMSPNSVVKIEAGERTRASVVERLRAHYSTLGVEFIDADLTVGVSVSAVSCRVESM